MKTQSITAVPLNLFQTLFATTVLMVSSTCHSMLWFEAYNSSSQSPDAIVAQVTGGRVLSVSPGGARLYSPTTRQWTSVLAPTVARGGATLTRLLDGKALAVGGLAVGASATSEAYDPATNTWSGAATLTQGRYSHRAVALPDGRVMVIGGFDASGQIIFSAEVYNASANNWTTLASLPGGLAAAAAYVASSGQVVVTTRDGSVKIYTSSTDTWTSGTSAPSAINSAPGVVLSNGRILIPGVGLYDVTTNSWSPVASTGEQLHVGAALGSGRALFSGSKQVPCTPSLFCVVKYAFEYDSVTGGWSSVGTALAVRGPALALDDGSAFFLFVAISPSEQFSAIGTVYGRTSTRVYIANGIDFPLNPQPSETYTVSTNFYNDGEVLNRPLTGSIIVSDGDAICNITAPATSCQLTTQTAGAKTISATYAGDINYASSFATYTPQPHLIIVRSGNVGASSSPSGLYYVPGIFSVSEYPFAPGTTVVLSGVASSGSSFTGWLGPCTGTASCTVTMPGDRHLYVQAYGGLSSHAPFNADLDRDGTVRLATDGLIALRYMRWGESASLGSGATVSGAAPPGGSFSIYLRELRPKLDIDGNGQIEAQYDGVLLLRYLLGLRGNALIENAISSGARRTVASDIESYLQALTTP